MEIMGQLWIIYNAAAKKQSKPLTTIQMQKLLLSLKVKDIGNFLIWTPGWTEWKTLVPFIESEQKYFVMSPIPKPPKKKNDDANAPQNPTDILQDQTSLTRTMIESREVDEDFQTKGLFVDSVDADFTRVDVSKNKANENQDYGYYFNDFRAEDIDVDSPVRPGEGPKFDNERRAEDRHEYKLEIVLISRNGKTFRSFSSNISLGGTLLEDEVPKDFLNGDFELMIINKFETDRIKGRMYFQGKIVGDFKNPKRLTFKDAQPPMLARLEGLLKAYLAQQDVVRQHKKSEG